MIKWLRSEVLEPLEKWDGSPTLSSLSHPHPEPSRRLEAPADERFGAYLNQKAALMAIVFCGFS